MQIKNAVSMIPYGLLSGIVDGQEVRICSFFRKMEGAIRSF